MCPPSASSRPPRRSDNLRPGGGVLEALHRPHAVDRGGSGLEHIKACIRDRRLGNVVEHLADRPRRQRLRARRGRCPPTTTRTSPHMRLPLRRSATAIRRPSRGKACRWRLRRTGHRNLPARRASPSRHRAPQPRDPRPDGNGFRHCQHPGQRNRTRSNNQRRQAQVTGLSRFGPRRRLQHRPPHQHRPPQQLVRVCHRHDLTSPNARVSPLRRKVCLRQHRTQEAGEGCGECGVGRAASREGPTG